MNLSEMKNMDLSDLMAQLQGLDPQNIGSWPMPVKVACWLATVLLVVFIGYTLDLKGLQETLSTKQAEEESGIQELETKAFKSQNLKIYEKQLKDMEDSFGALLRQLPQDTEVPGLLEDISHTAAGSGLDIEVVDVEQEQPQDFYVELPIAISVRGNYHAFGAFVSGIAALPRIVTLQDFKISPLANKEKEKVAAPVLSMKITAKTYRYNDKEADQGDGKERGKKGKPDGKKGASK